jgi:hypothetical protein
MLVRLAEKLGPGEPVRFECGSPLVDDDDEIHPRLTNGGRTHIEMDEAFCARMRAAIEAGLENAPTGVVTTPGTKNPKYVPAEPFRLSSSQRAMEHA